MNHPDNLKYVNTHEYIDIGDNDIVTIGITDFAQDQLGDVTFVELPKIGTKLDIEKKFGVIESVKSVSDLFMPVSGEIVELNSKIEDSPELVNSNPYTEGWLIKVKLSNKTQLNSLMSSSDYIKFIAE